MSINTLNTHDLESRRQEIEDELDELVSAIPDDINDEGYLDAAETLANWLGIADHDHLEFIGRQVWDQGTDELIHRWATQDSDANTLKKLNELRDKIQGWSGGVTLIDDDDFEEYAQEYAADACGFRGDLNSWPCDHIDWAAAADALKWGYEEVEYEGVTYQYRA